MIKQLKTDNIETNKHPAEIIQELDYEYNKLLNELSVLIKQTKQLEDKLIKLKDRK